MSREFEDGFVSETVVIFDKKQWQVEVARLNEMVRSCVGKVIKGEEVRSQASSDEWEVEATQVGMMKCSECMVKGFESGVALDVSAIGGAAHGRLAGVMCDACARDLCVELTEVWNPSVTAGGDSV